VASKSNTGKQKKLKKSDTIGQMRSMKKDFNNTYFKKI
jgi:hypothetical protein